MPITEDQYADPIYNWVKTSTGYSVTATANCINDGTKTITETVAAVGKVTKPATCEADGEMTYTAEFESEKFTKQIKKEVVPATGHDWDNGVVTQMPTTYSYGVRTYTCKNDPSHTRIELIPKLTNNDRDDDYWSIIAALRRGEELRRIEEQQKAEEEARRKAAEETARQNNVWKNPVKDVSESDPYYDAVRFVNENGLFIGVAADEFAPDTTMTRAMFVTVLGRLAKVDVSSYISSSFKDVKTGLWYSEYVEWAAENGIILGYGDGRFGPEDLITKEQAALIIARYAKLCGINTTSVNALFVYADSQDVSEWATDAVAWADQNDIYVLDNGWLNPQKFASRATVAMMLKAFVELVIK